MSLCEAGPSRVLGSEAERRTLILAAGALVSLRRQRWQDAVVEVLDAAHACRTSPYLLAEALLELVSGEPTTSAIEPCPHAKRIARRRWGALLNPPPGVARGSDSQRDPMR